MDTIIIPADIALLNSSQLQGLCRGIREILINTVSQNGGHLASNLGVVELTVALHRVFRTPRDKILWDVGHQSYVHKLLTDRGGKFSSLRQRDGISGFPDPAESPHDAFCGGHAGTSLSAALGIAQARDQIGEEHSVIAVIGDGSLGSGVALEALNHAGHQGTHFITVLNDNGLSISPTVGALHRMINRIRFDSSYEKAGARLSGILSRSLPGRLLLHWHRRITAALRSTLLRDSFWEKMGFVYLGPLDGHNVREIESALRRARDYETRPVIVHVKTVKGKGYGPAEDNAVKYHGISPRTKKPGLLPSYSSVFADAMIDIMKGNDRVVAITAAMLDGTGLSAVRDRFPKRVFDVGICEQHAVTMAAGMATRGLIPIVAIYSTFLQRAFDQIAHDVCLQNLPVIFAVDRAGLVGDDGKTHQGAFDISYLRCLPHLTIAAPKDEDELRDLLVTAVEEKGPFAIRFPRGSGSGVTPGRKERKIPVGSGEVLRAGADLAIIAVGSAVSPAMKAAEILEGNGVQCTVVNARFIKPLDERLILETALQTPQIVTVEENALAGGFGSAVLELLSREEVWETRIACIGIPDRFIEHGTQEELRRKLSLDAEGIAGRALRFLGEQANFHFKKIAGRY